MTPTITYTRTWTRGNLTYTQVGPLAVQVSRGRDTPPLHPGETRLGPGVTWLLGNVADILATAEESDHD